MNELAPPDTYGVLTEPTTLEIQRLLPGPIERVWAYVTESELRRKWLAAGEMELKSGAAFTLTWRNDELTDPPGERPEGFSEEHSMDSRIVAVEPPRKLVFTWGESGEVSIGLEPKGEKVLLTLVHRRLSDPKTVLMVGPGWHAHLDVLDARLRGEEPLPHWDNWTRLQQEYTERLSG